MATLTPFEVLGTNTNADFTLKVHRGEGMSLLAMNWKNGTPPLNFVGFAIEYKEPGGATFYALKNRLCFDHHSGSLSSLISPFQKFRWVHFPKNADLLGDFTYRVTPMFMDANEKLSPGAAQQVQIALYNETYPDKLNVTFTRGFVSSQAFVDYYGYDGIRTLLPKKADDGLIFIPTHPKQKEALAWMGFEARREIFKVLDQAIADPTAKVYSVAYDLSCSDIVDRMEKLGNRLQIIIDDSGTHGAAHSGETLAAARLQVSAGTANVKRQHMGQLQHNKTIIVIGNTANAIICGSTNYSWRGFYVQANNAIIIRDKKAIPAFMSAFNSYWNDTTGQFKQSAAAQWQDLSIDGIDAKVAFSPHSGQNALLAEIAADVDSTKSNMLFSLAFIYQTTGLLRDAVIAAAKDDNLFVYGISDKKVGGINVLKPNGKVAIVSAEALSKNVPKPFKIEPSGGMGTRMHHKFIVLDFDKPSARVYMGSYNFSPTADTSNGENLLLIKDRRIVIAYMIEALRIFDHYHFRLAAKEAKDAGTTMHLAKAPKNGEAPWWAPYYQDQRKIKDRELFSK